MISVFVRVSDDDVAALGHDALQVGRISLAFVYESFLMTVRVGSAACRASARRARSDCSA